MAAEVKPKSSKEDVEQETTKKRFLKVKQLFWVTREMAEHEDREEILKTILKETIIYFLFVFFVTVYALGLRSSSMFFLTRALTGQFLAREFKAAEGREINFEGIRTVSDFWHYSESLLQESFFWENYYDQVNPIKPMEQEARNILFENKILGVSRLRMVKVRNDSCVIHENFRRLFLSCYAPFSPEAEDKKAFGLKKGKAWTYNSETDTGSLPYSGRISRYTGSGFYAELSESRNDTRQIIKKLKENLWITRGTRAIFVDFSVYNANVNLFAICKIIFEFPATGGVVPSASFHSVYLLKGNSPLDWFIFVCQCCFYALGVFYLLEELREIVYFKFKYFLQFWSYIDLTIIALALATAIMSLLVWLETPEVLKNIRSHPKEYGNMEYVGSLEQLHSNLLSVAVFFVYVKIFKYISFNKSMGQLNNTLRKCAADVLGFSIMFFIIFIAYAELGYLLFGTQVANFSSFGIAMFTLLRTILGDFDYAEIENANRILAPIYFLSYIFLVFFVLLNMFLAIINDTYSDVKTELAIAPDEKQMTEYIKDGFFNCLRKMGCKIKAKEKQKDTLSLTISQIKDALKKCGFSDLEIEMFFARYNIDPNAKVGEQNIDKLLEELDKYAAVGASGQDYVQISDFNEQQARLQDIERSIQQLSQKIEQLIRTLERMENVRRTRNR